MKLSWIQNRRNLLLGTPFQCKDRGLIQSVGLQDNQVQELFHGIKTIAWENL